MYDITKNKLNDIIRVDNKAGELTTTDMFLVEEAIREQLSLAWDKGGEAQGILEEVDNL